MKALFALLSFLVVLPASAETARRQDPIRVFEKSDGEWTRVVARHSGGLVPWHVQLDLAGRRNISADSALPARRVLKPGEEAVLVSLRPSDPSRGSSYRMRLQSGLGDPGAKVDMDHAYLLPWQHGVKHQVVQGYNGRFSHRGNNSLDFDLAEGEKVFAARGGVVVMVKQDSSIGGTAASFAPHANVIEILHEDGSWAAYAHLQKNSSRVAVGDKVKAGDWIALAGKTGQARGPHLHFTVYKAGWKTDQTLPTRFIDGSGKARFLAENQFVYARHPGGGEFKREFAADIDDSQLAAQKWPAAPDGKVRLDRERKDNRDFVYVSNGTAQAQEVTLSLASRRNARSTRSLPLKAVVPAKTKIWLTTVVLEGEASYQTRLSYRPARP